MSTMNSVIKPHKFEHFFLEFKHSIDIIFKNYNDDKYIDYLDLVNPYPSDIDHNKIIFNTEQLSRKFMAYKLSELSKNYTIVDYSSVNIEILNKINSNCNTILLPVLFNKEFMCFDKYTNKEFDVIFVGELTPRRHHIIKRLVENNLRVYVMTCCYDFKLKHHMILKAKVLINLHAADDYNIFEFARCSVPIFNDCLVVSEPALPEKGSLINDYVLSRVIFCEYNKFVDKVIDVVKNYEDYKYESEYSDLEELTNKEIIKINNELELII